MSTATSFKFQMKILSYDDYGGTCSPGDILAPDRVHCTWGTARWPASMGNQITVGPKKVPFPSSLGEPGHLYGGVLGGDDSLKFSSFRWNGSALVPEFSYGHFRDIPNSLSYAPQLRGMIQEPWNFRTVTDSTATNRTHAFSKVPDLGYPMQIRTYSRSNKPTEVDVVGSLTGWVGTNNYPLNVFGDGVHVQWTAVDTSVPEVMVDFNLANGSEAIANTYLGQYVGPEYTATSTSKNELRSNLETLGATGSCFYTELYPVFSSGIRVFCDHSSTAYLLEMTKITSMSTATHTWGIFELQPWNGCIVTPGSNPPGTMYAAYTAVPSVEYVPLGVTEENAVLQVDEQDGRRLTVTDDAFVYAIGRGSSVSSIKVIPDLTSISSGLWGTAYYGGQHTPLSIMALDSNGSQVAGVPITISTSTGAVGWFSGISSTLYTDPYGEIRLLHISPPLNDAIGIKSTQVSSTTLTIGTNHGFYTTSIDDFYTYQVWKDDPMYGATGASTSLGQVPWSPTALNGRKVILHVWDATATNPTTNEAGAFIPLAPSSYSAGGTFNYSQALTVPDPSTSTGTKVGAYWIIGPRLVTVNASVNDPNYGTASGSASFVLGLSPSAQGNHIYGGYKFPYGWRFSTSLGQAAAALGGALYVCINSIAGTYTLYYEGASLGATATYPIPSLSLEFDLTA